MAKVRSNVLVQGISGKFGNQIVFRQLRDGRTIMCKSPDFGRRVLSKGQKAHHTKFREGAAYAKSAAKMEPIYAQLAAGTMKNAYNVALADYFHPPVIHNMERAGGVLYIHASDDVMVTQVSVTVFDSDEGVLEKGNAVPEDNSERWKYIPNSTGRVLVEARDLAGNVTSGIMKDEWRIMNDEG